jgi:NAD(P)-dependent dehydrogenase (short-subunit alcohol dehydrogenase family)
LSGEQIVEQSSGQSSEPGRVVVTGGGGQIGQSVARLLASRGWGVGVLDRNRAAAVDVAAAIVDEGGRALALSADTTSEQQLRAANERFEASFGPATALVNVAGLAHTARLDELDRPLWERIVEANLTGTLLATKVFSAGMLTAGHGRVVMMATMSAVLANAGQIAYGAAKGGVISLTASLAVELGPHGVTVNAVCPGAVATPAALRLLTPQQRHERERRIPVGRLAEPGDVANAVGFLVARESSYINGVTLYVDGGLHVAGIF